jgi:hypothetical protein
MATDPDQQEKYMPYFRRTGFFKRAWGKYATKENALIVAGIAGACALAAFSLTAFLLAAVIALCLFATKYMHDQNNPTLIDRIQTAFSN